MLVALILLAQLPGPAARYVVVRPADDDGRITLAPAGGGDAWTPRLIRDDVGSLTAIYPDPDRLYCRGPDARWLTAGATIVVARTGRPDGSVYRALPAGEPAGPPSAPETALLARLGAPRWRDRDSAHRAIRARGRAAWGLIQHGMKSDDAEVRNRCQSLAEELGWRTGAGS